MSKHSALLRVDQYPDHGSTQAKTDKPTSARQKRYITPDGTPSFIRSEASAPRKRRRKAKRKGWSLPKVMRVCNLRQSAVERLIDGRCNGPCDTDDGEIYYAALVRIQAMRFDAMRDDDKNPKPLDTFAWAKKHTPKLASERPHAWFIAQEEALLAEFGTKPATVPSADEFAQELRITHAEVVQFKLKSVGAIDRDARQREYEEKLADRKRKQREREKAGDVIPHSQSMAAQKPWEAYGISEPTFRRWVRAGKVPAHPSQRVARVKSRKA